MLALSAFGAALVAAAPASADLRMCNNTGGRVSVALAYTDGQGWVSEGWWNLKSLDCATLLRGALAAQFYYVYAMDERGGEWKGKAFMCTSRPRVQDRRAGRIASSAASTAPASSRSTPARTRRAGRCS